MRSKPVSACRLQSTIDAYYAGALTYLHGHSVGGTNPSLLRAMGAGASVLAWDVVFNREVLGRGGSAGRWAGSEKKECGINLDLGRGI